MAENVKYLAIPQYETLSVKEIKKFISQNTPCLLYLPDESEWDKLPKQWLINIVNSVVEDEFTAWVKERIEERNSGIVKKKNLGINMDVDVMKAFLASTAVSSQ